MKQEIENRLKTLVNVVTDMKKHTHNAIDRIIIYPAIDLLIENTSKEVMRLGKK